MDLKVTELLDVTLDGISADDSKKARWREQAMAEFSSTGVQSAGDLASSDEFWTSNELPSVLATRLRESLNSIQEVEAEEQSGSGAAVSSPRAIGSSPLSPRSAAIRSPRPSLPDASSTFRADDRARKYTYRASTHMTQEQLAAMFQHEHEHGHGHEMLQSPVDSEFERNLSFDINDSSDIRLYGRRSLALKRSIEMAVGGLGGPSEDPAPRRPTAKRGRTATVVSWIRASRSPDNEAQMPRSTVGKQRQNAAAFITDVEPVALTFENLTFKLDRSIFSRVASHVPGLRRFATPEKYLLSNVSGHIEPGSLIALIGPSGAGKSTLLGLLSGKIQADNLKGVMELSNSTHVVDIRNRPQLARAFGSGCIGFVYQDDALFPNLTVRETLRYAAWMRLPTSMSLAKKNARVEQVIEMLGMANVAESRIGSADHPVLSGGQKRRVSIGVELVTKPSVLFLDEPTSGLDSESAFNVVELCRVMTRIANRTVIMCIHQPTQAMWELFDSAVILSGGRTVYSGATRDLKPYFATLGYEIPRNANHAEFALEVVKYYERAKNVDLLCNHYQEQLKKQSGVDIEKGAAVTSVNADSSSSGDSDIVAVDSKQPETRKRAAAHPPIFLRLLYFILATCGMDPGRYSTTFIEQFVYLCHRNLVNIYRTQEVFLVRVLVMIVVGLCLGTLFLDTSACNSNNVGGYIIVCVAVVMFNAIEALPIFAKERLIFMREHANNAYGTMAYSLAHFLVHLPFLAFLAIIFSAAGYWLVGLHAGAQEYIYFNLIMWICMAVGQALVVMVSTAVEDMQIANAIVTAWLALMLFFGGFFITLRDIPDWWIWFHYLSIFKWPFEGMMMNNYRDAVRCACPCSQYFPAINATVAAAMSANPNATSTFPPLPSNCTISQQTVIDQFEIKVTDPWLSLGVLLLFLGAFRVVSFAMLQWGNSAKK